MAILSRTILFVLLFLCGAGAARAEVLVRWDRDRMPAPESLGLTTLVVPAANGAAVKSALAQGYRVFLEIDASTLTAATALPDGAAGVVVRGKAPAAVLKPLRARAAARRMRVLEVEERGKWPHIRANWVTKNNDVLQVSNRSSQPWIENNAALMRILRAEAPGSTPLLTYRWEPITLSDKDDGPGPADYLVAIAEAGSFGADLLLPLHRRFEDDLLMGRPDARIAWDEIRRHIAFYSWDLPLRHQPIANIGLVAAEPMLWFEVMNLLARHNLPATPLAPGALSAPNPPSFDLLIVLTPPAPAQLDALAEFARKGGVVVLGGLEGLPAGTDGPWKRSEPQVKTANRASYALGEGRIVECLTPIGDPNAFALEIRQLLGPEHRAIDIWNGITVIAAPYADPNGPSVLVTALNYAHQPLPVQLRIRGTFSRVHYESPDDPLALLPYQHRDGYTEITVPALRIGGRLFLSR
jgi:hypothetical protein